MTDAPWLGDLTAEERANSILDYCYDNLSLQDWELVLASAVKDAERRALHRAAKVAKNGCLVPPDGGSPTADEVEMCDRIARGILQIMEDVKWP